MKDVIRSTLQAVFPDRQSTSLFKWELKLLLIHLYAKVSPVEWTKIWSLRNKKDLKLNLGSGALTHEGWMNTDCRISWDRENLVCDLRRRFPLPDGSVTFVFAEHVLEHFGYPEGIEHVLRECHRVLQPGGILRVIIPDAERYLRAYAEGNEYFLGAAGAGIGPKMAVINKVFRENEFHKYAYDYETPKLLLEGTGFRGTRRSGFRESQYEELNLDLDEFERRLQSLYVEAVK